MRVMIRVRIPERVVRQLGIQAWIARERSIDVQKRVTVGRCPCDELSAYLCRRACTILDNELLTEEAAESRCDDPR